MAAHRSCNAGYTAATPKLARRRLAQKLPERPRCQNPNRRVAGNREQILIAGDQDFRLTGNRGSQNPAIAGIVDKDVARGGRLGQDRKRVEDRFDRCDPIGGHFELGGQDPTEFGDNNLADHQLMLGEDGAEHIGAKAARGQRGDEYVGIEADPHETARNTSSSVR